MGYQLKSFVSVQVLSQGDKGNNAPRYNSNHIPLRPALRYFCLFMESTTRDLSAVKSICFMQRGGTNWLRKYHEFQTAKTESMLQSKHVKVESGTCDSGPQRYELSLGKA